MSAPAVGLSPHRRDEGERWRRHPSTLWRHTAGAGLVLLVPGHEPVHVTGAGGPLWSLLAQPTTVEAAVDELSVACGVPREVVAPAVAALLLDLEALGAVTRGPSAP